MKRSILALLLGLALCAPVASQQVTNGSVTVNPYPQNAIPITGNSGNVANSLAFASIPAVAGKTSYICGFHFSSSGSTAAAIVLGGIGNIVGGGGTFVVTSVAGATLKNPDTIVTYTPCIPANAPNTAVTASVPALGAGNTNASIYCWGYQL